MSSKRLSSDLDESPNQFSKHSRVNNINFDELSNSKISNRSLNRIDSDQKNYVDSDSGVYTDDNDEFNDSDDEAISKIKGESNYNSHYQKNDLSSLIKPARTSRKASIGGKWSYEEDVQLSNIVKVHGPRNWKQIATLLGTVRSDVQCLHRWNKVLKPGLLKGGWTMHEDQVVKAMVMEHGVGSVKWSEIANQLPGRIGKQCRERWFNHLDPMIKKGEWTDSENRILYEAQRHFGNRWCEISKMLPGRTENAVKNRWNSSTMRKWLLDNQLTPGPNVALVDQQGYGMDLVIEEFSKSLKASGVVVNEDAFSGLLLQTNGNINKSYSNIRSQTSINSAQSSFVSSLPESLRPPKIETSSLGQSTHAKQTDETTSSIIAMLQTLKSSPVQKNSLTSSVNSDFEQLKNFFVPDSVGDSSVHSHDTRSSSSGKNRRFTADIAEVGSKRSVMFNNGSENSIDFNTINKMLMEESTETPQSPTTKAVNLTLKGLGIYSYNVSSMINTDANVPLSLLPYFKYLNLSSQRLLMKQLLERFQRTSFTPRNFCLANTPTAAISAEADQDVVLSSLGLGSPFTALNNKIDPNCFEIQENDQENSMEKDMSNITGNSSMQVNNNSSHSLNYARIRGKDKSKWTSNGPIADWTISAAVTVALQLATGSASSALLNVLLDGQIPSQSINKLNNQNSNSDS